ncbi:hypothetical protein [Phormidium nigroviride]
MILFSIYNCPKLEFFVVSRRKKEEGRGKKEEGRMFIQSAF